MNKTIVQFLVFLGLLAVVVGLLFLPGEIEKILDAQAEVITAEGHRELDFAAAEAIRANARQVDAVTTGIYAIYTVPIVILTAVAFVAILFLVWKLNEGSHEAYR